VPADPQSKGGSENTVKIAKADLVPTSANLLEQYREPARQRLSPPPIGSGRSFRPVCSFSAAVITAPSSPGTTPGRSGRKHL